MARPMRKRPRNQRDSGAVSTEFAVVFGAFVLFSSTVLVAGKIAQTEIDVRNAAQEAARAATLQRDETSAIAVAKSVGAAQVSKCENAKVDVKTNGFQPGGVVTVIVSCDAENLFTTRKMSASATEVIDVYRGSS